MVWKREKGAEQETGGVVARRPGWPRCVIKEMQAAGAP